MMPDDMYVVFSDQTDLWWLKSLRRGFRHCFVLLRFADVWMCFDPLAHKTDIMRIDIPESFSLIGWLEGEGDRVVKVPSVTPEPKPLWPALFSCVEAVKRVIGVRAAHVVTPWQLFKHLQTLNKKDDYHGKCNIAA